jgi:hypothetical protein
MKVSLARQLTTNPEYVRWKLHLRPHVSKECSILRSSTCLRALLEYIGHSSDYIVRVKMKSWMCTASSRRLFILRLEVLGTSALFLLHAGIRVLRCAGAMLGEPSAV